MFQNRMTITELLDYDWSADIQECTVTLRVQVTEIDNYFDWYKIYMKVKDAHGQTTLVLFNAVAEKLLDTFASKLVNRLSSVDNDVPLQIQSLCGKKFVFRLKLNNFNLKERLENFTVTKLFIPDEELELQHKITKDKKEHVSASLENFGDPQEDSDGSNCHKKQSAAKKKLLVKNNKKTETTSGDNLEEDSHDDDGFKGWKRRASSRKITKKRRLFIEDE
ncbi:hypothetical protein HAX54_044005 [Datura stramonium]|uniref:Replication factor A C-terminal domain-containing protein n=1 Tax=Datura stramonium TaxID=4076 RepID=A0ABS8SPD0_DATST|nr:hypothetical protein [Datura stramonium]